MVKWPDVPECSGWLQLDRRGNWRMNDEIVHHTRACQFLSRHYRGDAKGRWYVQNGPQKVLVELEYTPWVYRYHDSSGFSTHTGVGVERLKAVYVDDDGNLLLLTELGPGVVDDRDLGSLSAHIDDAEGACMRLTWRAQRFEMGGIERDAVPQKFGFQSRPRAKPP